MSTELQRLLVQLAAEFSDVEQSDNGGAPEWRRRGQPFAALSGDAVELRLHPDVAEAAARTPDARLSERGRGWIGFAPRQLDGPAVDRVRAWFMSAWRQAGE